MREELSRTLDMLAGNDPTKPEDGKDDPKFELWKNDAKYGIDKALGTEDLDELMGNKPDPSSLLGKALDKTSVTAWKWDNDGQPLWQWGAGGKGCSRTDLPGGGAAGVERQLVRRPAGHRRRQSGLATAASCPPRRAQGDRARRKGNAYATYGPATVQANGEGTWVRTPMSTPSSASTADRCTRAHSPAARWRARSRVTSGASGPV